MTDNTMREAFEKIHAVLEYARWSHERDEYVWCDYPLVTCPEVNDVWEAFCEGAEWQSQHPQGQAVAEVDAICKHCNQEYPVPLTRAGNTTRNTLCNFCDCPHCGKRNDLWICVRPGISGTPAPAAVPDAEKSELLDLLCTFFTLYEGGVSCYEDPESHDGFLGYALRLDDDDFHRIADILNRYRPVAPAEPDKDGESKD